jgi:hypothetical protein
LVEDGYLEAVEITRNREGDSTLHNSGELRWTSEDKRLREDEVASGARDLRRNDPLKKGGGLYYGVRRKGTGVRARQAVNVRGECAAVRPTRVGSGAVPCHTRFKGQTECS